jgi:hypothetical protein
MVDGIIQTVSSRAYSHITFLTHLFSKHFPLAFTHQVMLLFKNTAINQKTSLHRFLIINGHPPTKSDFPVTFRFF